MHYANWALISMIRYTYPLSLYIVRALLIVCKLYVKKPYSLQTVWFLHKSHVQYANRVRALHGLQTVRTVGIPFKGLTRFANYTYSLQTIKVRIMGLTYIPYQKNPRSIYTVRFVQKTMFCIYTIKHTLRYIYRNISMRTVYIL